MGKLEDAASILEQLGLPKKARGKMACLTLLALAGITEHDGWDKATQRPMTVRKDIMQFMSDSYGVEYRENTRESVRKSALRPFEQANLIERNPDDPSRAPNSSRTCYVLSRDALSMIRRFGSPSFRQKLEEFRASSPLLQRIRHQRRTREGVPVRIEDKDVVFSPGPHNELLVAVLEDFKPCFLRGAHVLYACDAESRTRHVDEPGIKRAGLVFGTQMRRPDVIFYDRQLDLLCFVEVVTSSGAITDVRLSELERMLKGHSGPRLFVTAFPSLEVLRKHVCDLAWGTEVWVASEPRHLIHFNGPDWLTSVLRRG
jgi:hypothetical protein